MNRRSLFAALIAPLFLRRGGKAQTTNQTRRSIRYMERVDLPRYIDDVRRRYGGRFRSQFIDAIASSYQDIAKQRTQRS